MRIGSMVAIAAAIGVLVSGCGSGADDKPAAPPAPAAVEFKAVPDSPLSPGHYRYIGFQDRHVNAGTTGPKHEPCYAVRWTTARGTWVPAVYENDWKKNSFPVDSAREWVNSDEATAISKCGYKREAFERRAPARLAKCGHFVQRDQPCSQPASWNAPSPEFLAALPTDPAALYDRLRSVPNKPSRGAARAIHMADMVLYSGYVPAEIRRNIYAALATAPGVTMKRNVTDLSGRPGVAITGPPDDRASGKPILEIIVNPDTSEYLGHRTTLTEPSWEKVPTGTVMSHTSVRYAIANSLDDVPR